MIRYLLVMSGVLLLCSVAAASDFKQQLAGKRLTYQSAKCAGMLFDKNGKTAYMFSELTCKPDLELRLKWLSPNTFVLIEKNKPDDTSPPRTFIYRLKSLAKVAVLTQVWTGWDDFKDQDYQFNVE